MEWRVPLGGPAVKASTRNNPPPSPYKRIAIVYGLMCVSGIPNKTAQGSTDCHQPVQSWVSLLTRLPSSG